MPIVETPPMPRATPASSESAKPHIPFPDTGSYPARTGNKLRPLIDGTPASGVSAKRSRPRGTASG